MEAALGHPPIENLPYDTLLEIFKLALDGQYFNIMRPTKAPIPWILAAVNRRWREIATGSPELWTSLILAFVHAIYDARESAIADDLRRLAMPTVGLFLERSQTAPLSILLDLQHGAVPQQLIDIVGATAARWRELEVWQVVDDWHVDRQPGLLTRVTDFGLPPTMSSLEKLSFYVEYYSDFDIEVALSPFAQCPRLRDLTLDSTEEGDPMEPQLLNCDPLNRKFPWSQLTRLKLRLQDDTENTISLEIIRSCINLEHLDIDECNNPELAPTQRAVLPVLRSFKLEGVGGASGTTSRLQCPALETLVVDLTGHVAQGFRALSSMFKVSQHPLQLVDIEIRRIQSIFDGSDSPMTDDALAAMHTFFDVLPPVKKLNLNYSYYIGAEYLAAMANHPEDLKTPRMEHLVVSLYYTLPVLCQSAEVTHSILALVEMYMRAPGSVLKVVDLIAGPKEQPELTASEYASDLMQEFKRYNDNGALEVRWRKGTWNK